MGMGQQIHQIAQSLPNTRRRLREKSSARRRKDLEKPARCITIKGNSGRSPRKRRKRMTVNVDASRCIGCGMCAAAVPAVFQIQGRVSVVQAQPRTPAEEAGAFDAANGCPVNAIRARKA